MKAFSPYSTFARRRLALVLTLGALAPLAGAQSAWNRLAQMISPDATVQRAADTAAPATGRNLDEVPIEADAAPRQLASSQAVASLQAPGAQPGRLMPARTADSSVRFVAKADMDLGLESEDTRALTATNLLDDEQILRLLGDNPRFRYDPNGKPDPMLMPWVRNAAIFAELNSRGTRLVEAGDLDAATDVFQRILELNDPRYTAAAMNSLNEISALENEKAMALMQASEAQAVQEVAELPGWVQDNTSATIVSGQEQLCLVGEHMLAVGDEVPDYPGVRVAMIEDERVLYEVKNQTFEVMLTNR